MGSSKEAWFRASECTLRLHVFPCFKPNKAFADAYSWLRIVCASRGFWATNRHQLMLYSCHNCSLCSVCPSAQSIPISTMQNSDKWQVVSIHIVYMYSVLVRQRTLITTPFLFQCEYRRLTERAFASGNYICTCSDGFQTTSEVNGTRSWSPSEITGLQVTSTDVMRHSYVITFY